ncbi:cysteine-rich CWC family protein [Caballeronia sp. LZ062]|uniref:cysteine-rich CWC family protein n=1 Tax=unclassified Caballeronia TaxID=2646786 RepID=UPI002862AEE2|nr:MULTISPECIES: cysteine-rich CWC family protein [unclassified Caballeronia]MDR5853322.1 cysteine-rich CWC family protein [Caballeronia sp. LZ050]MDR5872144.1 cysteine-rich CWC family protein [Caballeronia sp. LZ062]
MTKTPPRTDGRSAVCTRCGATFRCGSVAGDAGCWCASLPALPPERLRDGDTCLCRACLLAELAKSGTPG